MFEPNSALLTTDTWSFTCAKLASSRQVVSRNLQLLEEVKTSFQKKECASHTQTAKLEYSPPDFNFQLGCDVTDAR